MRRILLFFMLATCISTFAQETTSIEAPIKTVERVFKDYIKYSESTDSPADKDAMAKALKSLQVLCKRKNLPLLINVWMYYDPTDFSARELIEPIFYKNRTVTINAVSKRIKKRRKWENRETAPYSELFDLKDQLLKSKS